MINYDIFLFNKFEQESNFESKRSIQHEILSHKHTDKL